jgi:hypothetical protein
MATYYSPRVPTSGLVLLVDAMNRKSYPGSGTTWSDLSGNGNHFSMQGTVTWDPSGYFTGWSTSNYWNSTSFSGFPTGASARTIVAVHRTGASMTAQNGSYQHVFHYGAATTYQSMGVAYVGSTLNNHTWSSYSSTNYTISVNTHYITMVTFNGTSTRFIVNGSFATTVNETGALTNTGTNFSRIGIRITTPAEHLNSDGRIHYVSMYNRVLANDELIQIYDTLRGRYGI